MSKQPKVSLVIVSQKRPAHLPLLLQSLRHQTHPAFEVVLVADSCPDGFVEDIKFIPFQIANISAARNEGVRHSAGEIIAFCDDDAIPDPAWLTQLTGPFSNQDVGATTGFTRGRNGITRQWGAMRFDRSGVDHPFELKQTQAFDAAPEMPVKLLGTNMAFRKSALLEIHSFDEAYRFFLDETDAKLRLDQGNWKSVIVPQAQVHHNFAASDRRLANRAPTDLFEVGASKAYFCKTHMSAPTKPALQAFTNEQLARLTALVEQHKLRRANVRHLMETLGNGFSEGLTRVTELRVLTSQSEFQPFNTYNGKHIVLCARPQDRKWMRDTARELVNDGNCVSVIELLPSPRYFQVRFEDGYWLHKGGVFGKSIRSQPLLKLHSYQSRFTAEVVRIAALHPVDMTLYAQNGWDMTKDRI